MKLFYSDPLKAAYMALNYEIKFIGHYAGWRPCLDTTEDGRYRVSYNPEWWKNNIQKLLNIGTKKDVEGNPLRFYIHPDSYAIFKPKVGDYVTKQIEKYHFPTWISAIAPDGTFYSAGFDSMRQYEGNIADKNLKIIQRNGKAFFMPEIESEDANKP